MVRQLYQLMGSNPSIGFSPYAWRNELALRHKNLNYEVVAWHFTDKEKIAFSKQGKIPVLVDAERVVNDSFAIACYLDEAYPSLPLMKSIPNMRFINSWADNSLIPALRPFVALRVYQVCDKVDADYYRQARESLLGMTLEAIAGPDPKAHIANFQKTIKPLQQVLTSQAFIGGECPDYADYIVMGSLMWVRCLGCALPIEQEDTLGPQLTAWYQSMLNLYEGFCAKAPCYPSQL